MREGLEETLTLHRLGIPGLLRTSLSSTNLVESALSAFEAKGHRVKRWRSGQQAERWGAWRSGTPRRTSVGSGAIASSPGCERHYARNQDLNDPSLSLRSPRGEKRRADGLSPVGVSHAGPTSWTPQSALWSMTQCRMGWLATGTSCLGMVYVSGRNRVPFRPASAGASTFSALAPLTCSLHPL